MLDPTVTRVVSLDLHKHYLMSLGMTPDLQVVFGPRRVPLSALSPWIARPLTPHDAVVMEMTTNTWQVYDELQPHVHSVTVVHPPHIALITRTQVMTDKIACRNLARLHASGLTVGIWVPPAAVRDQRAVLAERAKMIRLATQAKNRLHAVVHRQHLSLPAGALFAAQQRTWWLALPVSVLERERIRCDLDTLAFAQQQEASLTASLLTLATSDERMPLLLQLPGINQITAQTILAAVGDIRRFAAPEKLVGYAGLGSSVHISGQAARQGRITKAGRRDVRPAMVEAAQSAATSHPHWMAELARLEPRLGHNKAIVAIARKLLVTVWHVWSENSADHYAEPEMVATKFLRYAYRLGQARRLAGQSAAAYAREQMDRLGIGAELVAVHWGQRLILLPPSRLSATPAS